MFEEEKYGGGEAKNYNSVISYQNHKDHVKS